MAATVLNEAQIDILNMMQWVKSPEALADLLSHAYWAIQTANAEHDRPFTCHDLALDKEIQLGSFR